MKIVCDNCATKYSIADDKVRGKVFKIRCKKCSHIIVVRGTGDGAVSDHAQNVPSSAVSQETSGPTKGFAEKETKVFDYAGAPGDTAAAAGADGAVWHLVIDREQVGPMNADDVRARFARGEIDGETYAWREGFSDWQKLSAISDFGDLMAAPPAAASGYGYGAEIGGGVHTQRNEPGDLFASSEHEAADDGLFASAPAAALDRSAFPHGSAQPARADLFSGSAGPSGGGGLFASPAAAPADDGGGLFGAAAAHEQQGGPGRVEVRPMTGQRNENSVLFSLSNLQALAMTAKGDGGATAAAASASSGRPGHASSQAEGSGLIDIRAMAASTLGASAAAAAPGTGIADEELPAFGASAFSPVAAPVLLPVAETRIPNWVWGLVAGGGVLLVAVIMMVVMILRRPPPTVVTQAPPPSPMATHGPGTPSPAPVASLTGDKKAPTPGAASEEKKADVAPAEDKKGKKVASSSGRHHGARGGSSGALPELAAPSLGKSDQPLAPTKTKSEKKAGGDELDRLLEKAVGGASAHSAPPPPAPREDPLAAPRARQEADPSAPDVPSRSDIQHGMAAVKPRVNACYGQYNVPGTVFVSVTISPSGRVQSASAKSTFAGTPTGTCVERAVKSASFSHSKNGVTIDYPFLLSK
ncbi:MAG TPA: GYF domain-containing protein [Polyangia bacterium]|nr:GYF domain-containing protein [Polyangia bacterium]